MLSVKGTFQNGVARPNEPVEEVEEHEGRPVIITFLEEEASTLSQTMVNEEAWNTLSHLIEDCGMETGITDLAHQHDHYLSGKPKKV